MKSRRNLCIIVDAYSSGNTLAGIINAHGYQCLHVSSSSNVPPSLIRSFRKDDFIEDIHFDGDHKKLVNYLNNNKYFIKCVIAGSEPGVMLADSLSEELGVATNGTRLSSARRDKFIMMETIRAAGLTAIDQIKSDNLREALAWSKKYLVKGMAIVIKPLASSSTDGFHLCRNSEDIRLAFNNLLMSKDIFGNTNSEVLVQKYIEGEEYCVNMVGSHGKHQVSDVWKIKKSLNAHSKIYDIDTLIDESDENYLLLVDYAKEVVDALGVKHGPTHTEIMIDSDGRPIVIESAARLMGSLDLSLVTEARGSNAALLTVESYLANEKFALRDEFRGVNKVATAMVQLISRQCGVLKKYEMDNLHALESFHGCDLYVQPGASISQTVSTVSSPGLIFLLHKNRKKLESDYEKIRSLEVTGEIYSVRPSNTYPIVKLPTLLNTSSSSTAVASLQPTQRGMYK